MRSLVLLSAFIVGMCVSTVAEEHYLRVNIVDRESEVPIPNVKVRVDYYQGYDRQAICYTSDEGIADIVVGSDHDDQLYNEYDIDHYNKYWLDKWGKYNVIDRKDIHISHADYHVIKASISWSHLYWERGQWYEGKEEDLIGVHGTESVINAWPRIVDEGGDFIDRGGYCEIIAYMLKISSRDE